MKSMEIYERLWKIEIPNDVVEDIMVRLPVRSLIRFQAVSKHWRSLVRSKAFGERYLAHHKSKAPKLLFFSQDQDNICFELRALEKTCTSLEDRTILEGEKFKVWREISPCCDGVFCFYQSVKPVQVINVATMTSITLPLARYQIKYLNLDLEVLAVQDRLSLNTLTRFGFGKNSVTGRYKLVWLYNIYPGSNTSLLRCEVLDLEDTERKWRLVTTTPLEHLCILYDQRPTFVDGFIYWLTGDDQGYSSTQTELIVFDIHSEMFQIMATPPFISRDAYGNSIGVCNLDGRLCISEMKYDDTQDFWWRGRDDTTWDKIFSIDLIYTSDWFGGIIPIPITPLAISNNKVILSITTRTNLVAFDLDPDSPVYHLFYSGLSTIVVPYFPSLVLFHENFVAVNETCHDIKKRDT